MLRYVILLSWSLSIACGASSSTLADDDRPNILILMADNWAWPHASALGDPVVRTPTFDRLANEGITFRNAFCSVPSCAPTRRVRSR